MESDKTKILFQNYWKGKDSYTPKEAMGLQVGQFANDNTDEFQIYGNRLCDKIIDMYHEHSLINIDKSVVLEIGCGMGRYALPFSKKCKFFYGLDISEKMISECDTYLKNNNLSNYQLSVNDGVEININQKLDFIFSTGVFQHIVLIDVIINYIKTALHLLNVNGILIFQFMGFYKNVTGNGTMGAKITSKILNQHLKFDKNINYKIKEINIDPKDPMKQIFIILQKIDPDKPLESVSVSNESPESVCPVSNESLESVCPVSNESFESVSSVYNNEDERDFEKCELKHKSFRTGVFEDLKSYTKMVELWRRNEIAEIHKLTFYE